MNWRCTLLGHSKRVEWSDAPTAHDAPVLGGFPPASIKAEGAEVTGRLWCERPGCDWSCSIRPVRVFERVETP